MEEKQWTIQLSSPHSVILMVVAGGSTAQSLEAEQKNRGGGGGAGIKGNGIQSEGSQGVPPSPPDLSS